MRFRTSFSSEIVSKKPRKEDSCSDMMHHWNLVWDWNVVESVRSVHSFFEGLAIALFALLVLFDILAHLYEDKNKAQAKKLDRIGLCFFGLAILSEIAAHVYSERNDELSENEIRGLSAVSRQARIDANAAAGTAKGAKEVSSQASTLAQDARRDVDLLSKNVATVKGQASMLSTQLAEALRDAAKEQEARLKIDQELKRVAKEQKWRKLDCKSFSESIKGKPKASAVALRFQPEDPESYEYAISIKACLENPENAWRIEGDIEPLAQQLRGYPPFSPKAPLALRHGALGGLALVSSSIWARQAATGLFGGPIPKGLESPMNEGLGTLLLAFMTEGVTAFEEWDESVPLGTLIIVIGPAPKL